MNEYQDQDVWWDVEQLVDGEWRWAEDWSDRDTAEGRRDYFQAVLGGEWRSRRVSGLS